MQEPRTLLEALVRQRQLSWEEAARAVSDAAREHGRARLSLSSRHLARLARRERTATRDRTPPPAGRCSTPTVTRSRSYSPPTIRGTCSRWLEAIEPTPPTSEVLTVAADRARRFMASLQTTSDESLQLVQEDVRDLVRSYPTRPLPEVLGHMVSLQDAVLTLLERPQRPATRASCTSCPPSSAACWRRPHTTSPTRTPRSRNRGPRGSAPSKPTTTGPAPGSAACKPLISYWARRPHDSVRYAQRGAELRRARRQQLARLVGGERGAAHGACSDTPSKRAPRSNEPRTPGATSGPTRWTRWAASRRSPALDSSTSPPTPSPGYPSRPRQPRTTAEQAVAAYSDPADPDWAFGDAAGSRADLAIARIHRGEIDGAAEVVAPVLELPAEQRINGIVHSRQPGAPRAQWHDQHGRYRAAAAHRGLHAHPAARTRRGEAQPCTRSSWSARESRSRVPSRRHRRGAHARRRRSRHSMALLRLAHTRASRRHDRGRHRTSSAAAAHRVLPRRHARDDDSIIGFARLGLDGVQAAKLGYAVAADLWGQGLRD